jgi:hypothetical protein
MYALVNIVWVSSGSGGAAGKKRRVFSFQFLVGKESLRSSYYAKGSLCTNHHRHEISRSKPEPLWNADATWDQPVKTRAVMERNPLWNATRHGKQSAMERNPPWNAIAAMEDGATGCVSDFPKFVICQLMRRYGTQLAMERNPPWDKERRRRHGRRRHRRVGGFFFI